jgi:hypothetical protein
MQQQRFIDLQDQLNLRTKTRQWWSMEDKNKW